MKAVQYRIFIPSLLDQASYIESRAVTTVSDHSLQIRVRVLNLALTSALAIHLRLKVYGLWVRLPLMTPIWELLNVHWSFSTYILWQETHYKPKTQTHEQKIPAFDGLQFT